MATGIRVQNLGKVVTNLKKKAQEIQTKADRELSAGAFEIATLAKQLAPKDEGGLAQSIVAETKEFLKKGVVTNKYYAGYLEFGTGRKVSIPVGLEKVAQQVKAQPKRGGFEEMVKSIAGWLRRHGSKNNPRWVAIMILKNGIAPRPYFFRALDAKKDKIRENIKRAVTAK